MDTTRELMEMTVCIVASYVSHNEVTPQGLPELINNVHAILSKLAPSRDDAQSNRVPAVPIGQSVMHLLGREPQHRRGGQ